MQKAFEESRNRMRKKLENEKKIAKKKQIQTKMGFLGIIIVAVILLILANSMKKDAIKSCEKNGFSYNYCVNHA